MRVELVPYLHCPVDSSSLDLTIEQQDDDGHIITGKLVSAAGRMYPIEQGVPNLLPPADQEKFGETIQELSRRTTKHFGYEWHHYKRFGWMDDYPDVEHAEQLYFGGLEDHSRAAFLDKSMFEDGDLSPSHLVLDAGCGNGRHLNIAQESGATLIGIDLGPAVYIAFENTRQMENVHIVRGNLIQLPFVENTFDRIYSIGVLMHTGDAQKAFSSLAKTLKSQGVFAITVYGVGRKGYEIVDRVIRAIILPLPIPAQLAFSRIFASYVRWMGRGGDTRTKWEYRLRQYVRWMPTTIHNYDWWAAPIATHHTLQEVEGWYKENGMTLVASKPELGNHQEEMSQKRYNASITAKGMKQ